MEHVYPSSTDNHSNTTGLEQHFPTDHDSSNGQYYPPDYAYLPRSPIVCNDQSVTASTQIPPSIGPARISRQARAPSISHSNLQLTTHDTDDYFVSTASALLRPQTTVSATDPARYRERTPVYSQPSNGTPLPLPSHRYFPSSSPFSYYPTLSRSASTYSSSHPRSAPPALGVASAEVYQFPPYPLQYPPTSPVIPRAKQRKQGLLNADRVAICRYHQENPDARQEDIAARYGVERSTISGILKHKARWLNVSEDDDIRVARLRPSKFPEVEEELVAWFAKMKQQNTLLTDALIRNKAKETARNLQIPDERFKASSGWVENFRHRHNIRKGVWLGGHKSLRSARGVGVTHLLKGGSENALSLNLASESEPPAKPNTTTTEDGDNDVELEDDQKVDPTPDTRPVPGPSHMMDRLNFPPPLDLTPYIFRKSDRHIAGGGFGDVYRCWCRQSSSKEVAVKAFRFSFTLDEDKNERSHKMLRRELGIWRRLNHDNIVPFLGIAYGFGMLGAMSLVSLWMENGSLHHFFEKHKDKLDMGHRLQLLLDTARGLNYLHSFPIPIVHGDLNCNNVLIDADYTARLADFGYASLVGSIPEALTYLQRSTIRPGALRWMAPEQMESEETFTRTTKSDIYSFGCIALQESSSVLSGKQPWAEVREDMAVVLRMVKGHKPDRPASHTLHDLHWNLIQQCWSSAEKRPTAEAIISFIQQFLNDCPPPLPLCEILVPDQADRTLS